MSVTQIRSGAHNGSRWGLKGTEDLGGGLKARLRAGIRLYGIDATALASPATKQFSVKAFVGLSGGFGAITVGHVSIRPDDSTLSGYDPHGATGSSVRRASAPTALWHWAPAATPSFVKTTPCCTPPPTWVA
jgi:predicted porin